MADIPTTIDSTLNPTNVLTRYVILRREDSGDWSETTANIAARSSDAALRAHLDGGSADASGTYVAVPARSWKPVTVKAETTTVLRIEEAG